MTIEERKRRPLGLGASKSKAPKLDAEEAQDVEETEEAQVNPNLYFDLPENDESEEAELDAIFKAAENAVGMCQDAADENGDETEGYEELEDKARTLLNAVINECNRRISEAEEKNEKVPGILYRYLMEAVYQRETFDLSLFDVICFYHKCAFNNNMEDHYSTFIRSILEDIKDEYSSESWYRLIKLNMDILKALVVPKLYDDIVDGLEKIAEALPGDIIASISEESLMQKIWKFLNLAFESPKHSTDKIRNAAELVGLKLYDCFAEGHLPAHLQVSKGNWLARAAERRLEEEDLEGATAFLDSIKESVLPSIKAEDDSELCISAGELVCLAAPCPQ
jgi:hypothetical protein